MPALLRVTGHGYFLELHNVQAGLGRGLQIGILITFHEQKRVFSQFTENKIAFSLFRDVHPVEVSVNRELMTGFNNFLEDNEIMIQN